MENEKYLELLYKVSDIQNYIEDSEYKAIFADLNKQLDHFYRVVNGERMAMHIGPHCKVITD
tara:strand:+ start:1180 stop:1365 length:186 start_codon:yes stop_codon:yes gene_type:complete